MAWTCSGFTNDELVDNLYSAGIIKSERIRKAMKATDRKVGGWMGGWVDGWMGWDGMAWEAMGWRRDLRRATDTLSLLHRDLPAFLT